MRADRHIVEYRCDQCPEATGYALAYEDMPCPRNGWSAGPPRWFVVSRDGRDPVHLCSMKCLREYASKVEGDHGQS